MTQLGSASFEGDTWDLASSVGLTATMVAAACRDGAGAIASDHFAEPLVTAVGVDFFSRVASGELNTADPDDDTANGIRHFATPWRSERGSSTTSSPTQPGPVSAKP
ncbi:putative S-adenosyl-L-methionine-dependent methyltransferase [Mycobacterium kansasii 732]|uniref:S-adenosyl-L-methionine-dependent methyltransferase n=1 Tax=Mycobacterium pseudokansasii TaxID=2341080 RepID=A0A498QJ94_9MYCO|nr:putative S-adenosyl-L-methionine-dependent methyltransferase [Mycobacterium kansasii 732]KZS64949.1 hypothetical protein A4G27_18625 [Mycobacterium kansasii]VAZ90075.1 Putative S-adenosyl-L-methionine-dependent methyltransferase [Mycobacterium pseudokansasii]VAZ90764.1 Putative S-adenosyl-L-methionine-dependent methyltransferase [Mycobacterium pseudokansasii]VBA47956.1 Putative S-adenosyl-L-methionine-dependent methyltransferase [Mycobacterium pseudokansasii]